VNVRRLLLMIEESIDEGSQWVVLEPKTRQTTVTAVVDSGPWPRRPPADPSTLRPGDVRRPPRGVVVYSSKMQDVPTRRMRHRVAVLGDDHRLRHIAEIAVSRPGKEPDVDPVLMVEPA
jgi:hypothetical protein